MPRGKNHAGKISNSCNRPHKSVTVDSKGNCFLCTCDGWLPIPAGQVQDFGSFQELFSNPIAKMLQQDVLEKKYTWCAVDHCGIRQESIDQHEYFLALNIDESCNLWCPSCRRDPIMHSQGVVFDKKKQDVARIITWLDQLHDPITIELSGNGDPLASSIIRPLFQTFQPKPSQKFILMTNGLLIKKQLHRSKLVPNIISYSISVDAATSSTYENVRRGGKWKVLVENFDYLERHGQSNKVQLNFAVQQQNFRDIPEFIALCKRYGFRGVCHQLDDWGTWNYDQVQRPDAWTIKNGTYLQHNVLSVDHDEYLLCQSIISQVRHNEVVDFEPRLLQLLNMT